MRPPVLPALAVLGALAALALTGCEPGPAEPADPEWTEVALPAPPGPEGRVALRDAVACGGRWYVVGGVFTSAGAAYDNTQDAYPAAWTSADGRTFEPLEIRAATFWGALATLTSVACSPDGGTVVAVGARSGGAHGLPRVTTFHGPAGGPLVDVDAATTLFGGSEALAVYGVAGGPGGWLIPGGRTGGGAVWTSTDGTAFTLVDADPALASGGGLDTLAVDAVADGDGWAVVGSAEGDGRHVPLAWASPDGRTWARQDVPAPDGYGSLDRVAARGDDLLAAGLAGDAFGLWRRAGGAWERAGTFGAVDPDATGSPYVASLAVVPDGVLATASDGTTLGLWAGEGEDWRTVAVPEAPPPGADRTLGVATSAEGAQVLLWADDGEAARLWAAPWPPG